MEVEKEYAFSHLSRVRKCHKKVLGIYILQRGTTRYMRIALIPLILVLVILVCGCTAVSPASTAPVPSATPTAYAMPNITGTWTGTMQAYDEGTGFTDHNGETISIVVAEQHDRIFSGNLIFEKNGTEQSEDIAGTIGRDGRTLTLIEKNGYSSGIIVSDNEIELTYMRDGPQFTTSVDSLKKV